MANIKFLYILWAAAVAVLKLVLLTITGALMERWQILNPPLRKSLSQMIFYVFTPCLIFVKIADGITLDRLTETWPLLVYPLAYALLSGLLGYAALYLFCMKDEPEYVTRSFVASLVFINAGNMPFTLIQSIARDVPPFSHDPKAEGRGIAYVAVYVAVSSTLLWTAGYHYMRQASDDTNVVVEQIPQQDQRDTEIGLEEIDTETHPGRSVEMDITSIAASSSNIEDHERPVGRALEAMATPPSRKEILKQIFNPTLLAIKLALVVVAIRPLQNLFFADGSDESPPLAFLAEAADQLGDTAIPLALLLLGGVLYANYENGKTTEKQPLVSKKMLTVSCMIRLIIMPAAGFLMTVPFMGKVMNDQLMNLTILIESGMPAAVNLIVVSGMCNSAKLSDSLSSFLLWQYAASCLTSIVLISIALSLIL